MKTTLYMAISANGMIAAENGSEDFLSHENWLKFCELAHEFGNFIVGRKTYEAVKEWNGGFNFEDLPDATKVVVSQDVRFKLGAGYMLASSPEDALAKLSRKGFEKCLVVGGGEINSAFVQAGLLDEIIFNVEPVFVGKGIPVFSPAAFDLKGKLISVHESESGIVTLKYAVVK